MFPSAHKRCALVSLALCSSQQCGRSLSLSYGCCRSALSSLNGNQHTGGNLSSRNSCYDSSSSVKSLTPGFQRVDLIVPLVVALSELRQQARSASSASSASSFALTLTLRSRRSITRVRAQHLLWIRSGGIIQNLPTRLAALRADVVSGLCSFVGILLHCLCIGRVDDHDHALLTMLSLRAVDVHRLVIDNGDHERRRIGSRLTPIVLSAIAPIRSWSSDRLEVGENGVGLWLARRIGIRRSDAVVLRDEVESDHIARLSSDRIWRELKLVVGSDGDGHDSCGSGTSREEDDSWQHIRDWRCNDYR
jgi:hypothetical protein